MAGIQLMWDNTEQTCYRMEFGFGWTWTQFIEAIDKVHVIVAEKEYDVNLIMWFKASLPPGNATESFKHAGGTQPPNLRHTVFVNESTRFLDILINNTDRREGWVGSKIVRNLDDAHAHFHRLSL
jgi:hypothetical protein